LPLGSVDTLPADLPVPTPAHVRALELTLTGPRLSFQDALQQAEARWIADRFEEILADPMAARSADDLVVLVFQHSHARPIADELSRRGLAVQILGDTNFLNLPPIRLARDLLRVVRNPADPEPFLRLLLSPFGRLSDRGIYELAASRGDYGNREERARPLWQAAHEAQLSDSGDACELAAVVATIEAARSRIGVMALSEVLTRAFAERGVDDYYLSRGQAGRQAWANFRKLCRLSDVFQTEGHDSLDFAAHLDRMEEANAKIEAESLSPRDQSRIRIMTVHRAKGLEFPVVAVALASCYRVNHLYNAQFLSGTDAQGRLDWEWKLNDDDVETCSKGYEQRKADALARDDAEDIRKLYVACTRACHTLLLSYGTGTSATARTDGRCGLGPLVAEAVRSLPESWRPVIEKQAFCAADFEGPVHPDDQPLPTNLMPPRPAVTPSLASVAAVDFDIRQISASDITAHVRCPLRFYHFNLLRAGQLRSPDPQAAANRGSLIHLLLETVGRSKGNLDRSRIEAICAQHDVDPEDKAGMDALTSVLRNYLASQTADDLAACSRVEYEYPFYLKLNDDNGSDGGDDNSDGDNGSDNNSSDNSDNSDDDNNSNGNDGRGRAKNPHSHKSNAANYLYLHGFIDALGYRTDGTALVVDYKTGGQADEEQAKKEQEYEPQAAVYALVALTLGAHRVEVRMLRPEVPDAKDPTQAQTFSWTWDAAERHNLEARMLNYARAMRRTGRGGRAHTLGPPEPAPDERTCQFCAIAPQLCGRKRRIMDS
jgi:ATP-dependent exoDNAse (exonuclease V) beta subunit